MAKEEQAEDAISYFNQLPLSDHPSYSALDCPYRDNPIHETALDALPWILDCFQVDPLYSSLAIVPNQTRSEDNLFECGNESEFQPNNQNAMCSEINSEERVLEPVTTKSEQQENRCKSVEQKHKNNSKKLSRKKISEYFYMPIIQAAKELNVGVTLLKKRCRESGISRWPCRKLKSLQSVMNNVQALDKEEGEGETGRVRVGHIKKILEDEIRLMEEAPDTKLDDKAKRLRQACCKAKFVKKKKSHG